MLVQWHIRYGVDGCSDAVNVIVIIVYDTSLLTDGCVFLEGQCQFVLALGDNFYVDGVANTTDRLWDTAFHDVYSASSLNIPWYPILGNHGNCHEICRIKVKP